MSHVKSAARLAGVGRLLPDRLIQDQESFLRALALERKRTERSRRRFVLMLLDSESLLCARGDSGVRDRILDALTSSTRQTDIKGWYKREATIGVIFTEVGEAPWETVFRTLRKKVTNALSGALTAEKMDALKISFHVYPEDSADQGPLTLADGKLYPDLQQTDTSGKGYHRAKRCLDIVGAASALLFFAPLFFLIAILIKLTSKGPVLFRQQRLGKYGKKFTFLKFRSMAPDSDHTIHQEYVTRFIAAQIGNGSNGQNGEPAVYKLTGDPRVTRLGKILRRTSLDELPQFLNVLCGDMSLVGPRPPLPYEFGAYDIWHRSRLLVVKPGITGLWQVQGRSRVTFDEMVRLDLRYARAHSLWLDIKILLQTPRAMFTGQGAY